MDQKQQGTVLNCCSSVHSVKLAGRVSKVLRVLGPFSHVSRWAPEIPVVLYHGTKAERAIKREEAADLAKSLSDNKKQKSDSGAPVLKAGPVFITSYEISMNDRSYLSKVQVMYNHLSRAHGVVEIHCS